MPRDVEAVRAVLQQRRSLLMSHPRVVATGVGYKVTRGARTETLAIVCSVTEKVAAERLSQSDRVPPALDGVPTDVVATGVFRVREPRTGRHRPAPGGVSIAHRMVAAGTLGCLVQKGGRVVILSNNHVLANSNDARVGDAILQPGPHDGGRFPDDHIADLEDFVPIAFLDAPGGAPGPAVDENRVDAAIARPLDPARVRPEILEIGTIAGLSQGVLGMAIKKSGRTTGLTTGQITQVDVSVKVEYGPDRVALFADQLLAGPMSQGGDSGSVVLDNGNRLVGLLFAGSENSTVINRIEHVFSALGLSL